MSTKAKPVAPRAEPVEKIRVAPESWRTTAYIFFWSMCIFAICMAEIFVIPAMAKGPAIPGSPCGPFNRVSNVLLQSFPERMVSNFSHPPLYFIIGCT